MKKAILIIATALSALTVNAQQSLNVVSGNVIYSFRSTDAGVMNYTGSTVTVKGMEFNLSAIDRMEVTDTELEDNTVLVEYNEETATVTIAGNTAPYVSADVTGANVVLTQSDEVSEAVCGEITYILKGASTSGSLILKGSYKSTIELQGLTLTNPSGAAIDIQNGKRISVSAKKETVNTLTDGAGGSQKAALYCKGHLELKGKGVLNVTGLSAHAISAKEYVEIKNLTLNILGSVKDGINCAQYFSMESGTVTISNAGDDGIQVDYKDDTDREPEDTGSITISGGSITVTDITATGAKAIKCEGDFTMTGGEITASTSAPGDWNSTKLKTKASACIGVDGDMVISDGTLTLSASGGGGKGISVDGNFTFNGGTLTASTTGGVLAYVNGVLNQNYTGNTDRLNSDYKSSPKGVKADGDIIINGGTINVTTSGNGGEGMESKAVFTINDGYVKVRAKDDGLNSSSHMYIKGGTIDVISTGNDGLDSNGNLYIEGGLVMAFGASSPECGLDANEEGGYTVYFTGGYILAVGGSNSVPGKTGSTQPYVSVSATVTASSTVTISGTEGTLYSFEVPADYSGSSRTAAPWGPGGSGSLLISIPALVNGSTYTVKCGSTSTTGTARLTGSSGGRP